MNVGPTRPPIAIFAWLTGLGARGAQSIEIHQRRYLLIAVAIFGLFTAHHACTTPIWFDEFFTLFISRLPSLGDMLRAAPADGQPPLQYLLTRFSVALPGSLEFTLRLPELIACVAAGLFTWKIVRRHGTPVQALFGVVMLLGSNINFTQAYIARPYGLMLAFTALAFVCWQKAAVPGNRRTLSLLGLALAIAGAVLSHHFGIIHIAIFLLPGEAVRLFQRRRVDFAMACAFVLGTTPLVFTIPLARGSNRDLGQAILASSHFWARPTQANLLNYLAMIALPLLCLVLLFAFLPWPARKTHGQDPSLPPVPLHEWIAAAGLSLLLPALLVLTAAGSGYFLPRYAIGDSLGLALLAAWGLPRIPRLQSFAEPLLALSTLTSLLVVGIFLLRAQIVEPVQKGLENSHAVSPVLLNAPAGLPIVVASAFEYPPDWWYAAPNLRGRLIYLADPAYAAQQADFLPEFSLILDRKVVPMPLADYAPYIATHPHFLLLRSGESRLNWTDTRLAASGWRLTPIATAGQDVLYQADRQ